MCVKQNGTIPPIFVVGLWVRLSGVKWGSGSRKGVEVETVPGGLILPREAKIEEIRVELSLEPNRFSKIRPCRSLDIGGPLRGLGGGILRSYILWKRWNCS